MLHLNSSTFYYWYSGAADMRNKRLTLNCGYLHADETMLKVVDRVKKGTTHLGYYWVYQIHEQKQVLFDYQTGREREGP